MEFCRAESHPKATNPTLLKRQNKKMQVLLPRPRLHRLHKLPPPPLLHTSLVFTVFLLLSLPALAAPTSSISKGVVAQVSNSGAAAAPAKNGNGASPARTLELRLGMSALAMERLSEPRMRRLLDLELDEKVKLSPNATGPLGDHVAYVWLDLATASRVSVELRVGDKAVVRREVGTSGISWDVAARIVAITTSEMLRAQMRPVRPVKKPPPPKGPTPDELDRARQKRDALSFDAHLESVFLPSDGAFALGPGISMGLRRLGFSEHIKASWLSGSASFGSLRFLDIALGADYRVRLSRSFRLSFGASASMASAHLGSVRAVDGIANAQNTWTSRATLDLGLETRLFGSTWLGFLIQPGMMLRAIPYQAELSGPEQSLEGAWLGARIGLRTDWISQAEGAGGKP